MPLVTSSVYFFRSSYSNAPFQIQLLDPKPFCFNGSASTMVLLYDIFFYRKEKYKKSLEEKTGWCVGSGLKNIRGSILLIAFIGWFASPVGNKNKGIILYILAVSLWAYYNILLPLYTIMCISILYRDTI